MFRKISIVCFIFGLVMMASRALMAGEPGPAPPPEHPPPPPLTPPMPAIQPDRAPPLAVAPAPEDPGGDQPMYGFCPEQHDPGLGVPRPDLSALLALRTAEMMDQVRHTYRSGQGSPELRRALSDLFSGQEANAVDALAKAPDRNRGGFDYASSAAIVLGAQALSQGSIEEARRAADAAVSLAGDDPVAHVLDALVAERSHGQRAVRRALRRAHDLAPDEPAVALALGQALSTTADLDGAIAALSVYLDDAPMDVPIGQLRERMRTQQQLHQGLQRLSGGGVTLLWPEPELSPATAGAIHAGLRSTLAEAATLLEQRRRDELLAVIYRDRADMLASTCVPQWTEGVFDGVLRLYVDALADAARRQAVIRHEVFHAQLRAVPVDAPHWFHEGAAQHFAREEGPSHARSYRMMLDHGIYVPFASLEGSFLVISGGRDARLAYHQSLAMVQMIVEAHGPRALAEAVRYLRAGGDDRGLWTHMLDNRGDGPALLSHVRSRLEHML